MERQVYLMVDGQHTIAQLAGLLHASPEEVWEALERLRRGKSVAWNEE